MRVPVSVGVPEGSRQERASGPGLFHKISIERGDCLSHSEQIGVQSSRVNMGNANYIFARQSRHSLRYITFGDMGSLLTFQDLETVTPASASRVGRGRKLRFLAQSAMRPPSGVARVTRQADPQRALRGLSVSRIALQLGFALARWLQATTLTRSIINTDSRLRLPASGLPTA